MPSQSGGSSVGPSGPQGPHYSGVSEDSRYISSDNLDYHETIWSDRGYMNVTEGHTLNFQISEVPRSMKYQFYLRYQPKVNQQIDYNQL